MKVSCLFFQGKGEMFTYWLLKGTDISKQATPTKFNPPTPKPSLNNDQMNGHCNTKETIDNIMSPSKTKSIINNHRVHPTSPFDTQNITFTENGGSHIPTMILPEIKSGGIKSPNKLPKVMFAEDGAPEKSRNLESLNNTTIQNGQHSEPFTPSSNQNIELDDAIIDGVLEDAVFDDDIANLADFGENEEEEKEKERVDKLNEKNVKFKFI